MKRIVSILGILTIVFATFVQASSTDVFAIGNDVSDHVTYLGSDLFVDQGKGYEAVIQNGIEVEGHPTIRVGDSVQLTYHWELPETNMINIEAGDVFYIQLPAAEYMYVEDTPSFKLIDSNTGFEIGSWQSLNGSIVVTINETGAQSSGIFDGFFTLTGVAKKAGDQIVLDSKNNTFPTIKITEPEPGTGTGENGNNQNIGELPLDEEDFTKKGKQYDNKNIINWSMNINYDGLRDMIENNPVQTKNNVVLIDKLPEGMSVDSNSFYITTPIFIPTSTGKMGDASLAYIKTTDFFARTSPLENETYETFYNRIHDATQPTIGIYEDTVLISFANMPGNGITYIDAFGGEAEMIRVIDEGVSSGNISLQQANHMKLVYGSTSTTNGQIAAYDISFDVNVTGDTRDVENLAQLVYDNTSNEASSAIVGFHSITGGAGTNNSGKVQLTKLDKVDNATLSNAIFELQKQDGTFVSGPHKTNDDGVIKLNALNPGLYQFVEKQAPDGYIIDATPIQFEIQVNQTAVVLVEHYNEKLIEEKPKVPTEERPNIPAVEKPNLPLSKQEESSAIKTGDKTSHTALLVILAISAATFLFIRKRNV